MFRAPGYKVPDRGAGSLFFALRNTSVIYGAGVRTFPFSSARKIQKSSLNVNVSILAALCCYSAFKAITCHHGNTLHSSHYTAVVKIEKSWYTISESADCLTVFCVQTAKCDVHNNYVNTAIIMQVDLTSQSSAMNQEAYLLL